MRGKEKTYDGKNVVTQNNKKNGGTRNPPRIMELA